MTNDEDEKFWHETIKDVVKISPSNTVIQEKKKAKIKTNFIQTVPLTIYKHDIDLGTTSDIDRNTMRRFKKEEFGVEGTLDLHGYTEEMAYPAVFNFITSSYLAKKRCILIITGKGLPHPDEDIFAARGVLKDRVPQWLKTDELKQLILTYIHPSAKLGGSGALYILLRRNRS